MGRAGEESREVDTAAHEAHEFGPWNPGIVSPIPDELMHLCTVVRPENVYTSFREARELRGLTGLDHADLVAYRPERLALHELLVRVSADFSVPDGERIEDFGINFRAITSRIYATHLEPRRERIAAHYAATRNQIAAFVHAQLAALRPQSAATDPLAIAEAWNTQADETGSALQRSACRALAKVVSAVLTRHARLWGTPDLIGAVSTNIACNDHGSEEIGRLIEPWIAQAASEHGYRLLRAQERPVVMNTKGPSASGKSTLRPLQRRLAGEIGTDWGEFALISPDIWRKQLLDYGALGAAYKYAGPFTGDELRVIDQKLDQYMACKAMRGEMPHLLIDRFRFDSFAPDSDVAGSNLLTRFGSIIYLFFMITPPDLLVERAWRRGLEIEAYSGMPELFFTWVHRHDKRVHFEFLDNSVAHGERPRTVAFGWNDRITVLDVRAMLDVVRFRRIDVNAASPAGLFPDGAALAADRNTGFLRACVERFPRVEFANPASGRTYLRLDAGSPVWLDAGELQRAARDPDTCAGLRAAAPGALDERLASTSLARGGIPGAAAERAHTVGQWGP
jgi:hypothetical protein